MNQILLVEDNADYQKIVIKSLGHHRVSCAQNVDEALAMLSLQSYDLILLDIGLPQKDGYSLLSEIQSNPDLMAIPIICLTGKTEMINKVTAFSLGADDYIIKPFDPIEFKARVDSRLNKLKKLTFNTETLVVGDVEINTSSHEVYLHKENNKTPVHLTLTEFKLFRALASRVDQVHSRDQLLVKTWGNEADVFDRSVDVHICSLRKKIRASNCQIKSVPGLGYRLILKNSQKQSA